MWRKPEEPKPSTPASDSGAGLRTEPPRAAIGSGGERPAGGNLSKSITIRGEITGREDLYIDGEVQGNIRLTDGGVTVGPNGQINAEIEAREIIVHGKVKGPLHGRERVQIGRTGEVLGDVVTRRIAIEEGALLRGMVEITSGEQGEASRSGAPATGARKPRPEPVHAKEPQS